MMKTAAEINVERIEGIIREHCGFCAFHPRAGEIARAIVDAIPELRPHQQRSERGDRGGQAIAEKLPWVDSQMPAQVPTKTTEYKVP